MICSGHNTAFRWTTSLTRCFVQSQRMAVLRMSRISQKSQFMPPHWTLPYLKSSSRFKRPCTSTSTRRFPPDRSRLSYRTTVCWYWWKRGRVATPHLYLPANSAKFIHKKCPGCWKFNNRGAAVFAFWGHFGVKVTEKWPLFPQTKKKCVETYRFNALLLVAETGLEPATSGLWEI